MIHKSSSAKSAVPHNKELARETSIFACDPKKSRGRLIKEPLSRTRDEYQRDRDRIIHSRAFRRLKDKTQVFVYDEGDHYRTRLTHTIEVAQIARSISRALGLNEDLAEALALSHDLGHPPFGHAGERALDSCMAQYGGFDHNAQSLRVVTGLERAYADFDGLNLTWETLEGLVKHNGPVLKDDKDKTILPHAIEVYREKQDLWLWSYPSAEAQAASIADDIAYDAHDVDDALRAGLFDANELRTTTLGETIISEVDSLYTHLEPARRHHEIVRRVITKLIENVIIESIARLEKLSISGEGSDDVRRALLPAVGFSSGMESQEKQLKAFLKKHMYDHSRVRQVMNAAQKSLCDLFDSYFDKPALLPEEWQQGLETGDEAKRARRVCDFIAGMTDRFALEEMKRLTNASPDLQI